MNKNSLYLKILVGILLFIGVILIASVGVPKSIDLTKPQGIIYPTCETAGVDCYLLFKKHLSRVLIGVFAFIMSAKLGLRFWKKITPLYFIISIVMLIVVLILGSSYTTFATSWIVIFNSSLQPTELAKLAMILYLASWFASRGNQIQDFYKGFVNFSVLSGFMVIPLVLQPDLGSTMVLVSICVGMYFYAGAVKKHLLTGFVVALLSLMVIVPMNDYLKYRFLAYLNPSIENCQVDDAGNRKDYCWQTEQANIAVATGGFFGKGLTKGIQKSYWLPQSSDDFIFAASSEELGFVRSSIIVLLFFALSFVGFDIASKAQDKFAKYTAVGITLWLTGQAFINICVNIGLLPVTGITLPFISYGGSSLLATCAAAGILLSISKSNPYDSSFVRRRNRRSRSA